MTGYGWVKADNKFNLLIKPCKLVLTQPAIKFISQPELKWGIHQCFYAMLTFEPFLPSANFS